MWIRLGRLRKRGRKTKQKNIGHTLNFVFRFISICHNFESCVGNNMLTIGVAAISNKYF